MKGLFQFEGLWDKVDDDVAAIVGGSDSVENEASTTSTRPKLLLKRNIHRQDDKDFTAGRSFTAHSISVSSQNGGTLVSGRTLMAQVRSTIRTCKKALSFAVAFFNGIENMKTLKYPSGKNEDDFDTFVLSGMFNFLKGNQGLTDLEWEQLEDSDGSHEATTTINVASEDNEANTSTMPHDYIFNGWYAFKCFGPTAAANHHPTIFELGDYNGSAGGRAQHRKKMAEENSKQREMGSPGKWVRGRTLEQKRELVDLSIQNDHIQVLKDQTILLAKLEERKSVQSQIELKLRMLQYAPDNMKQELLQESRQLEQRVNEISIEIERLNKKSQSSGARTQSLLEEYAMLISNANTTMEGASATTSTPSHNVAEVDAGLSMDDPSMMTDP
jgi:hypothetical protein